MVCVEKWRDDYNAKMSDVGSPILIVRNDVTFLAIIAPLSFALLYREPRGMVGILAALSMRPERET